MKKILIVGLPFFTHKYQYVVDAYTAIGADVRILINSDGGDLDIPQGVNASYAGKNKVKRITNYLKEIRRYKPTNIDCYDYSALSIIYLIIARLLAINSRFWLIGGELVGDRQDTNKASLTHNLMISVKVRLSRLCLRISNVIFAKEIHHLASIRALSPALLTKVVSIYNGVPVPEVYERRTPDPAKDFIYANAVIEKRNVIDFIRAMAAMKNKGIYFSGSIYGFSSISNDVYSPRGIPYSERALDEFMQSDLNENVTTHGFVHDIRNIMRGYRFFVFPAETILANYALLEAMSLGLVPIVYPGEGYEEIVEDGINGIVVNERNLCDALIRALSLSAKEYDNMSYSSYCTIKRKFSLEEWKKRISLTLD